jgi:hypothetical protein
MRYFCWLVDATGDLQNQLLLLLLWIIVLVLLVVATTRAEGNCNNNFGVAD